MQIVENTDSQADDGKHHEIWIYQSVTSLNVNVQVSQLTLSKKTPLFLVCVDIFVDSTMNKWAYYAVNIFVAVLS